MNAQEITLNIAVNMGRLSRWAMEGETHRVQQFLKETEGYLKALEKSPKKKTFKKTFQDFKKQFYSLKQNPVLDILWAEDALTWANILTHRAKLA